VAALATAGIAALVITGLQSGTGDRSTRGGSVTAGLPIPIKSATDFDPAPGDGAEHSTETSNVLDGNPQTSWTTEDYENAVFASGKPGVGIYVKTRQPAIARGARIVTPDTDMGLDVYGAKNPGQKLSDWTRLGGASGDINRKWITLDNDTQYQYYLFWVNRLPSGGRATISEVELRR
jgi:hypothetical protein